jgi:hypothetical protein
MSTIEILRHIFFKTESCELRMHEHLGHQSFIMVMTPKKT